jgi:CheY-like chemotaxis protein
MESTKNTENVHLLLVEDNPRFMNELQEWLEDFGYHNLETASNVEQARKKLSNPFDVIIADMRMEKDESGFDILEQVKELNLSSVVIILTANDTVFDCRKAFKMGAWDYISKNMRGNVFEALHDSIQEAIAYFNQWGNLQNEQWINENIEELENDYLGQYIAVVNKFVIDAAETKEALEKRIEDRKLRRFLTTIRKIGDYRPISELVSLPENQTLEFKSTLQWDVKQDCQNKKLCFSVLKTIAGFLNSDGGILIIGVEDDGNIFGLEKDLSLMQKKSIDEFQQKLVNLITTHFDSAIMRLIRIRFEIINGKNVCAVEVKKSLMPVFMKGEYTIPEFYIRSGNTTRPLNVQELYNHLKNEFS